MAYFTNFGDVQRELAEHYRETGKRLQFPEAVDELYKKGKLTQTPPTSAHNREMLGHADLEVFSHIVDTLSFPVNPSLALSEKVKEDDIFPLLRDIFIIRHPRYTRPFPHKHNYVEIDCVVDGGCTLHFEEEQRRLGEGQMCIIAPYSRHDIEITDESTVYCVMLRRSTFEAAFFSLLLHDDSLSLFFRKTLQGKSSPNYMIFTTDEKHRLQHILQYAMMECHKTDDYSNIACISFINIMFATVFRASKETPEFHKCYGGADFSPVLRYIQQNYRSLTLGELAEHFHYSKPHLCTLMKQNTGVSFTELIRRIRMSRAVEYLIYSSLSVSEVADALGYHSADHFSRVFRAAYGMSPQEYRRESAEKEDRFVPFEME